MFRIVDKLVVIWVYMYICLLHSCILEEKVGRELVGGERRCYC